MTKVDGRAPNHTQPDGRGPSLNPSSSPSPSSNPKNKRPGPTTRAMARRIQEDWDTATDGRETFLYMFKNSISLV